MRYPTKYLLILLLLLAFACRAAPQTLDTPIPPTSSPAAPEPTAVPLTQTAPTPTLPNPPSPSPEAQTCAASPITAALVQQTTAETWLDWIEKLSGAEPVTIDGEETIITTRFSPEMFSGNPNARAFEYVHETVRGWYPDSQIRVSDYTVQTKEGQEYTWQNLTLTLPGRTHPEEIVILSAHLDSITQTTPQTLAPGAADNGSGSAALLEAARLFKGFPFERTVQIVWFTGEELGLHGSRAFVHEIEDPEQVVGVVNLDMFGFDSDGDRCFEVHVGALPESDRVGQCFIDSLENYRLGLRQYDYLTADAIRASDHASFWDAGIGAIEIVEDVIQQNQPGGCPASDRSPYYHTDQDTVDKLNPETGIMLVRAALATIADLARPMEVP